MAASQLKKTEELKPFWLSWFDKNYGKWELNSPWWVSGVRDEDGALAICAAVMAVDEYHAKQVVSACHDELTHPNDLEWRFCEERDEGYCPYSDRFAKAKWMTWPIVLKGAT